MESRQLIPEQLDCIEGECAWWVEWETEKDIHLGKCAIALLATKIFSVEQVP